MPKKYKKILFFIVLSVLLIFLGVKFLPLSQKAKPAPPGKIIISASIYPEYFFAKEIGGDKVFVYNITPFGVEPHDFEPTAREITQIYASRLLILNGGVEPWGNKIASDLQNSGIPVVFAGKGLILGNDPHIWLSPPLAEIIADRIEKSLEDIDPVNANFYRKNAAELNLRLNELDQNYKKGLKNCQNKIIIVSHSAFSYLATEYGLIQVPIAGLSPNAEPTTKQLADIAKLARDNNIGYIFYENLSSPKLAETLASEIGAKTLPLDPLEGLSNNRIDAGETYFSVMNENLTNLEMALKCSKP